MIQVSPCHVVIFTMGITSSNGYNSERNSTVYPGSLPPPAMRMGKVLLVDDDPVMILDQLTHALSPQGLGIDVAHTAEEGIQQVAAHPPDVILLDVHLPDLSGLEASQRIRQIDGRIPVISSPGPQPPTPPSRQ